MRWRALAVLLAVGCAGGGELSRARFVNARPVVVVDDRRDTPVVPAVRGFLHDVYHYDGIVQRRLERALELPRPQRALGVSALDEVPDSTWFRNRIGTRTLAPEEIERGSVTLDSPELHLPWTITSTKVGGTAPGFVIRDARGVKYLLKLDAPGLEELESGADVVVDRLLWACGYNVPEDSVVYVRPQDLVVAPTAKARDLEGHAHRLERAEVERILAPVERRPDGTIRALASRWLDGTPLGGHPAEGVRPDDPNDRIPHELRRDLRGAYTIFAWLDHVDVQEGNFLDMWIADRADPARHYVKHYMLDFGKSLGVMAATGFDRRRGHTYLFDLADMIGTLATAGLAHRDWEDRRAPALRGVGLFEATAFDPGSWHPDSPAYVPFLTADPIDKLWGARLIARFTRDQIAAAVAAARYSDPRAAAYIVETLVARQRATAAYWFEQAGALDRVTLDPDGALCFTDLALAYGLTSAPTRYELVRFGWDGGSLGLVRTILPGPRGETCTPVVLDDANGGYTIVRVATLRTSRREILIHLARDPDTNRPRVIGVWRP